MKRELALAYPDPPEARRAEKMSAQVAGVCDWTKSQANHEGLGK